MVSDTDATSDGQETGMDPAAALRSLAEAAVDIMQAPTPTAVMRLITDHARRIIGAHQAVTSLVLGPDRPHAISSVSLSDKYAAWRNFTAVPDGSGIYGVFSRMNQAVRMTQAELEAHPAWRAFGRHAGQHPPLRGWLAVPVVARDGRRLGLLQLSDRYTGDFTDDDLAVALQLAALAAAAVQRKETEERLTLSEQRLRTVLENATVGLLLYDGAGACTYLNSAAVALTGYTSEEALGCPVREILQCVPADHDGTGAEAPADWLVPGTGRIRGEAMFRRRDGAIYPVAFAASSIGDGATAAGTVVEFRCIADEKRRETARTLLMREVDHRARNALAVVQTMVRLTRALDPADFMAAVDARIAALARAHGLLARTGWAGVDLRSIVADELAPYGAGEPERFSLDGPALTIAPDAVQPFSMIVHELATNAAKHGALRHAEGRVAVRWWRHPTGLGMSWQEIGGPPVHQPDHQGCGSAIFAATLCQLGGQMHTVWDATGLRCVFDLSAACLVDPHGF